MKVAFCTLGCKVNQYDTQTMMERFREAGHEIVPFEESADCYVVNTCTVTAVSDKKSRQMIARAHKRSPDAIVVVAGCFAQRDAAAALALPGVKLAIGNQERGQIVAHVEALWEGRAASIDAVHAMQAQTAFEEMPALLEGRTRATLKIQEGCNRYCSYCIIPYARGPIRSRRMEDLVAEARRVAALGFSEIVLTGIHLASFAGEKGETLIDAVEAIAGIDGLARIRLGSLEPSLLTPEFARRAATCRALCPHFHVSMQSGSDGVLRRMNRRYDSASYAHRVATVRDVMPNAAITTDVIAGFPGESEREFEETFAFVDRMAFARIHVFPYSPRVGTPAATMPGQLSKAVKEERTRALIALGQRLEGAYVDRFVGTVQRVLFETDEGGGMLGYTDTYIRALLPGRRLPSGALADVTILRREGETTIVSLCGDAHCDRMQEEHRSTQEETP